MFALVRARCGGGAAAWVAGVLAAPVTQGSWQLGQREIQCSRRKINAKRQNGCLRRTYK